MFRMCRIGHCLQEVLEARLAAAGAATRIDGDGSLVVEVDDQQRTSVPGLLATGEVTGVGGASLAILEGYVAGRALWGGDVTPSLHERIAVHRRFAQAMHAVHGGRAGLQIITIRDELFASYRGRTDFIQRYIFPGGQLVAMGAISRCLAQTPLRLVHYEDITPHYAETLRRWRERGLRPAHFAHRPGRRVRQRVVDFNKEWRSLAAAFREDDDLLIGPPSISATVSAVMKSSSPASITIT